MIDKQSAAQEIMASLEQDEQQAIKLVSMFLKVFNSYDGSGIFTGVSRYTTLSNRLVIAASQSKSLFSFWGNLCRLLSVGVNPTKYDDEVAQLFSYENPMGALGTIRKKYASVIVIARMLHNEEKGKTDEEA